MVAGSHVYQHQELVRLLRACSKIASLERTKILHALTITVDVEPKQIVFLQNNVIVFYAKVGSYYMAQKVFDNMPKRNKASYNSMISCYSRCGSIREAWEMYYEMMSCGMRANNFTIASLLSSSSTDPLVGVQLQSLTMKSGLFHADAFVGTALLALFGRSGLLNESFLVFKDMPVRSTVTWNCIISLFARHGPVENGILLFRELVRREAPFSESSFKSVLCGLKEERDLELGQQIHGSIFKSGFGRENSVGNSLLQMYGKCTNRPFVERMLADVADKDVVTWNIMTSALDKSGSPGEAIGFFSNMENLGIIPNHVTFTSVIGSCTGSGISMAAECFHAKLIKLQFHSHDHTGSALVNYYAKCNKLDDAVRCFGEVRDKNVVAWNSLIADCAVGFISATNLLSEMLRLGCRPNEFSFTSVLIKLASSSDLHQIHCLIVKMGYQNNDFVLSSLISSYNKNDRMSDAFIFVPKSAETQLSPSSLNCIAAVHSSCRNYNEALNVLSAIEEPDVVSWNIAIAACSRAGNQKEAFELLKHMRMAGFEPDEYTYVSLLSVSGEHGDHSLGSSVHSFLIKRNFNLCDTFVCNVLIDMYGKCGSVESAMEAFSMVTNKTLITWTALISALGINGCARSALEMFDKMLRLGFLADTVAFLSALSACRHGRLVREGMTLFGKMISYGMQPEPGHYQCVLELLAKNGQIKEATALISNMPFPPNVRMWSTFLEGSKQQTVW